MDRFPISPDVAYSYEQRWTSDHHGTDILAPLGTPLLAVENGQAWSNIEPKGGKVVYLLGQSGARYFYGHLSEWRLQIISATRDKPFFVHAGDEIGKVGTTGNAQGRPPHVHFQIRLGSSTVVDPFEALLAADPRKRGIASIELPSALKSNVGVGTGILMLLAFWWLSTKAK